MHQSLAKADRREYICKTIFERAILSLGSDISYNAFSQDAGIGSHNTVHDYIEFLNQSFIIHIAFHYDINQSKFNYRKNKKIYFLDPFVFWTVERWIYARSQPEYQQLKDPVAISKLVENACLANYATCDRVGYFKGAREIDIVTSDSLIEVKYRNLVSRADYPELLKASKRYRKIILTKNQFDTFEGITLAPVYAGLLLHRQAVDDS